jgi:hypothetical protein
MLTATPSSSGGTYLWSPGGQTTDTITVSPTTNTVYSVVYTLNGVSTNSVIGTVTVNPIPTIIGNNAVCLGSSITLSGSTTAATANPWVSSNTAVASVTNLGVVTGVSAGTATITYTNTNNCSATFVVTVNAQPTVTIANQTICSGQQATLTASVNPLGGTLLWSNNQSTPSITLNTHYLQCNV